MNPCSFDRSLGLCKGSGKKGPVCFFFFCFFQGEKRETQTRAVGFLEEMVKKRWNLRRTNSGLHFDGHTHGLRDDEDVRKDDRGVDFEAINGLDRDLCQTQNSTKVRKHSKDIEEQQRKRGRGKRPAAYSGV